ncbi:hypothetical protein PE067_09315 [Paracoccus sp. DMF-8]|uniref:hypothetical protein n=1 Tax=Paracoccus sp. DMF-8 TaxID=3019445 RepID=UPI0023E7F630|nr:hypothetical protein [Paracoccus sp. DMF-8]MDF3606317.1 hypothetical protein [Paracoccus sp. DMF-8]
MTDDAKIAELLRRYAPEQLAAAYLKVSRERNELQRVVEKLRLVNDIDDMIRKAGPQMASARSAKPPMPPKRG